MWYNDSERGVRICHLLHLKAMLFAGAQGGAEEFGFQCEKMGRYFWFYVERIGTSAG